MKILKKIRHTIIKIICNFNYKTELKRWKTNFVEPGHYYSPYIDKNNFQVLYNNNTDLDKKQILGVDLSIENQFKLLEKFKLHYLRLNLNFEKNNSNNYYLKNDYFSFSDGITLSCLMLEFMPKRIIEIGSGYSSALMIDLNSNFFNNSIDLIFIEPYPSDRFSKLINDKSVFKLFTQNVQLVDLEIYDGLNTNDILFVDSSHVSKSTSDVNFIFFHILPRLKSGVIIHFHDIFYPFEYPYEWIMKDRAWNEAYLLRAFLQFNSDFEVLYFNSQMEKEKQDWFELNMPLCLEKHENWIDSNGKKIQLDNQGQSIYIRRK